MRIAWRAVQVLLSATWVFLRTSSVYTRHFLIQMLSYPVQLAAMYYIWFQVSGIQATSLILPYYAVVFMLQRLQMCFVMVRMMGDTITSGDIVLTLTRPFHLWQIFLGRSLARALGTLLLGLPVLGVIFYISRVPVTLPAFGSFLITALIGFVMEFLLFFCVGLTGFWTDRTWGQSLLATWLVEVLGGRLVPLFVLPSWAQEILGRLPFVHIAYSPAAVLLFPERETPLVILLAQQFAWLLVFAALAGWLWRRGVRRYQGYGL